jgi:hypothetical protein
VSVNTKQLAAWLLMLKEARQSIPELDEMVRDVVTTLAQSYNDSDSTQTLYLIGDQSYTLDAIQAARPHIAPETIERVQLDIWDLLHNRISAALSVHGKARHVDEINKLYALVRRPDNYRFPVLSAESDKSFEHRGLLRVFIDPGEASTELLTEFYIALSAYYRALGGAGLEVIGRERRILVGERA